MDYLKIADIEAFFAPALKAHGFKTVDERDPESTFGALRTVENDELQVTFIIDRGHPYIDVQAAGTDLSLSLASIYHWLKGERPSADRRAMLTDVVMLN